MPTVTVVANAVCPEGATFTVETGENLARALVKHGVKLAHACATCMSSKATTHWLSPPMPSSTDLTPLLTHDRILAWLAKLRSGMRIWLSRFRFTIGTSSGSVKP